MSHGTPGRFSTTKSRRGSILCLLAACFACGPAWAQTQSQDEQVNAKDAQELLSQWKEKLDLPEGSIDEVRSTTVTAMTEDPSGNVITLESHWSGVDHFTFKQIRDGATVVDIGCYRGKKYRFNPRLDDFEIMPEANVAQLSELAAMSGV